jgi:hypothetical protein
MKDLKKYFYRIILLIGFIDSWVISQNKNYFVSPFGNDKNTGHSINDPLRSINPAIKLANPGDTIFIFPGKYKEVVKVENKKGQCENPICITGLGETPDNFPVIDGGCESPGLSISNIWMDIYNSSWIEIKNINFKNGWLNPIILKNSSYISFIGCRFWGGKRVISAGGSQTHHLLVENCYWNQGGEYLWKLENDDTGNDAWTSMHHGKLGYFNGSLIDFHGTGGSIIIRKNRIENTFNALRWRGQKGFDSNIEIYDNNISNIRDNDFEPEYYTFNLHIYHNYSHNIHKTVSIDNVEGGNIYYYGNVITSDSDQWANKICTGFWKIYGTERNTDYPIYAFNNSFYGVGKSFSHMIGKAKLLKHFNNAYLFSGENEWDLNEWDSTDEFDYDISNKKWPTNIVVNNQEKNGKIAEIKFVDKTKFNLRLSLGSPGIDEGKILTLKEFDWVQSFSGTGPDIGAYEDGKLVDGPAFRYIIPPDGKLSYKEKPRIVRYKIEDNKLYLYFSTEIEKSSLNKDAISLFSNNDKIAIFSLSFPRNNYELLLYTKSKLSENDLSIKFDSLPIGTNGEIMTYWASVIKIHK